MPPIGLYPRGGPRPTTSRAEQALYRALRTGLPEGCVAWHSLRIRTLTNVEGEGDFVIAVPDRGVLVVEVKGGAIEVRDGIWHQNGRAMDRAPREQAHGLRNKLAEKLRERSGATVPWIAIATAFPETPYLDEPTQGDVRGAVLGQHDLPYLKDALLALVERLFTEARPPRDARWIDALHELWGETWRPRLALGARTRLREEEMVALDAQQVEVLDLVEHNPRVAVLGGPGTGKTLLAVEMLRRLTAKGRRPLLLCWTRALAAGLRAAGVEAHTVREHAADLLARAGVAVQSSAPRSEWTPDTWDIAPLEAAIDALPALTANGDVICDAVIVDECQDLTPNDWELVKALAGTGPLWAFGDDAQGFWADRTWPHELFGASLCLKRRYRCPEPLARFADLYRPEAVVAEPRVDVAPIDELRIVRAPSESAITDKVALEIQKALGQGVAPRDIAVVSLAGQTRTELCSGSHIGRFAVVRADDPGADEHVVADTFLRFKGLERPWIIVTELSRGKSRYDVRMHVALTRATVGCVVVATAEEVGGDWRLVGCSGA